MFRFYERFPVVGGLAALEANRRELWEESGPVGEVGGWGSHLKGLNKCRLMYHGDSFKDFKQHDRTFFFIDIGDRLPVRRIVLTL